MVLESTYDLAVVGVAIVATSAVVAIGAEPTVKVFLYPLAQRMDTKLYATIEKSLLEKLGREANYKNIAKEHQAHYPFPFGQGYREWANERIEGLQNEYDLSLSEMQKELLPIL